MLLKDYYKILEVQPVASLQEIKRSFRKLALKYHPDKNAGNHLSEAQFREIQEAYEVLSNPKKREEYNYKRWYNRSIGQPFTRQLLSPRSILEECRLIKEYVNSISIFQVDYVSLSIHIRTVLSDSAVKILLQANQPDINKEIIFTILKAVKPLPLKYLLPICEILTRLADNDPSVIKTIAGYSKERKQQEEWDKSKWLIMILVTALLCLIIYMYGK
jgi:molecular chaperone DnaJ